MNNEAKRKRIEAFNNVYYSNNKNWNKNWKLQRLPDWIDFYGTTLQQELNNGLPEYYRKFKQGTIVMVNYGVTVGSEMAGMHFAIVLSKNDTKYKRDIIVVPLSSKFHKGYTKLGYELLQGVKKMFTIRIKECKHKINSLQKRLEAFKKTNTPPKIEFTDEEYKFLNDIPFTDEESKFLSDIQLPQPKTPDINTFSDIFRAEKYEISYIINKIKSTDSWEQYKNIFAYVSYMDTTLSFHQQVINELNQLQNEVNEIEKLQKKIDKYNKESYANTNAIRSISKLRVAKFSKYSITGNVMISDDKLLKIKEKIFKTID